jgi:hypothetical protein
VECLLSVYVYELITETDLQSSIDDDDTATFHKDGTQLGPEAVYFNSYVSMNSGLATCVAFPVSVTSDDRTGGESIRKNTDGDKHNLESMQFSVSETG